MPSLLIPQGVGDGSIEPHPGTIDVDLGLELMVLDNRGYADIADLLRGAGYRPEEKEEGRVRRQTWRSDPKLGAPVTIDFLIPRSACQKPDTRLQSLEADFAAVIADGLQLVERDRRKVRITGTTLRGETADRSIWVCGPASFVVLKARAIHLREKPKDAFDLNYILANSAEGTHGIATSILGFLDDKDAREAMEYLATDYVTLDSVGPARAAFFRYGARSPETQQEDDAARASAYAYVRRLLDAI